MGRNENDERMRLRASVQEKIKQVNLRAVLGVEGVHSKESEQAQVIGQMFSILVIIALMAIVVQLILGLAHDRLGDFYVTVGVWVVFAVELGVNLFMVEDKKRYLLHNWLNVAIVVFAFPWLNFGTEWAATLRTLRFLILIRVVADLFQATVTILKRNNFWMVLLAEVILIVVSGFIFAALEHRDFSTGLWYSLVTITTVGYGDVVPITEKGQIFGTILILFGVVFFSLITANISAFLVGTEQRKTEKEILDYVKTTKQRLEEQSEIHEKRIDLILKQLTEKLDLIGSELEHKEGAKQLSKDVDKLKGRYKEELQDYNCQVSTVRQDLEQRIKQRSFQTKKHD